MAVKCRSRGQVVTIYFLLQYSRPVIMQVCNEEKHGGGKGGYSGGGDADSIQSKIQAINIQGPDRQNNGRSCILTVMRKSESGFMFFWAGFGFGLRPQKG